MSQALEILFLEANDTTRRSWMWQWNTRAVPGTVCARPPQCGCLRQNSGCPPEEEQLQFVHGDGVLQCWKRKINKLTRPLHVFPTGKIYSFGVVCLNFTMWKMRDHVHGGERGFHRGCFKPARSSLGCSYVPISTSQIGHDSSLSMRATLTFMPKEPGKLLHNGVLSFGLALQHQPHLCSFRCNLGVVNIYFLKCLPVGSEGEPKGEHLQPEGFSI